MLSPLSTMMILEILATLSTLEWPQNLNPSTQLQDTLKKISSKKMYINVFLISKTQIHFLLWRCNLSLCMWYNHIWTMQNNCTELYYYYSICKCQNSTVHNRRNLHAFKVKLCLYFGFSTNTIFWEILTDELLQLMLIKQ